VADSGPVSGRSSKVAFEKDSSGASTPGGQIRRRKKIKKQEKKADRKTTKASQQSPLHR
jgi:hypothetical protein